MMRCLGTEACWCAACTDRELAAGGAVARLSGPAPSAGTADIAWIFEAGLEQKLSGAVLLMASRSPFPTTPVRRHIP
jgi:hypothetical protein